ncbi:MAG: hypothetical protein H0T99_00320 [Geodermatophilaceae bacterium]|nr:hypothetical protein [Geodermatophilaceae bacterium]
MNLEQKLRDTLRHAADDVGTAHPAAGVRSAGMRALVRRRSRRRATVLGAGLAVLLVGVGIPTGTSLFSSSDNSPAGPQQSPAPIPESTAEPTPSVGIFDGPARGSLAGDADFLEAIRELPWEILEPIPSTSSQPAPPRESRRVVFAGDVPEGRWALVVADYSGPLVTEEPTEPADSTSGSSVPPGGETPDPSERTRTPLSAVWYAGGAQATADQMELVRGSVISSDLPESIYDPTTGALVVVAAPGDLIEVSQRPRLGSDGTVSRAFADVASDAGVASTSVEPQPFGRVRNAVQVRVSRAGVVLEERSPSSIFARDAPEAPAVGFEVLRPSSGRLGADERTRAQDLAAEILGSYGLRPAETAIQVSYSGPIGSLISAPADLVVVTVTFPSGAVVSRAQWFDPFSGTNASCGAPDGDISPARESSEPASLAFICSVDIQSFESNLIVLAPAPYFGGYAVAEGGSAGAGTIPVGLDDEGVGMLAFHGTVRTVAVYSASSGAVVDRVPVFTY